MTSSTSDERVLVSKFRSVHLKWTSEEDNRLQEAVQKYGARNWKLVAEVVGTRDAIKCLQRWKRAHQPNTVKGPWSETEDRLLLCLVAAGKYPNWGKLSAHMIGRSAKQCRGKCDQSTSATLDRWLQQLSPDVSNSRFSPEEDAALREMHARWGNQWAKISHSMPGRTENSVKKRFQSLEKRLLAGEKQTSQTSEEGGDDVVDHEEEDEEIDNSMPMKGGEDEALTEPPDRHPNLRSNDPDDDLDSEDDDDDGDEHENDLGIMFPYNNSHKRLKIQHHKPSGVHRQS
eukprot:gene28545-37503_t